MKENLKNVWHPRLTKTYVASLVLILLVLTAWGVYPLYGHAVIRNIYESHSLPVLNSLIRGQSSHALEHYLRTADGVLYEGTLYSLLFCVFLLAPVNLRISFLCVILPLALIEGGMRVQDFILSRKFPELRDSELVSVYDPLLGWKKGANLEKYYTSREIGFRVKVATNSKGLRDEEYDYAKPADVKRILLLGDSFVIGTEVDRDRVIDVVLERLLASQGKYQVINAGTRGYGTDQEYLFLINEGYKYSPDVVIYTYYRNDLADNVTIHNIKGKFGKPYFTLGPDGTLNLKGVPVPKTFFPDDQWRMADPDIETYYNHHLAQPKWIDTHLPLTSEILKISMLYQWFETRFKRAQYFRTTADLPPELEEREWQITTALIHAMKNFSTSIGAEFLIYKARSPRDTLKAPTKLEDIAQSLDADYLLSFAHSEEYRINPWDFHVKKDNHWNERGHALAAQDLYEFITQRKQKDKKKNKK